MFGKILIYLLRDTAIFKILWSFLVLFKINNITNKWTSPLFLFLLGYGFLIILYDLFTESKVFKNKYIFIILMFIILMGISVIANYENRFNDNIRLFISTSIQIIIRLSLYNGVKRKIS